MTGRVAASPNNTVTADSFHPERSEGSAFPYHTSLKSTHVGFLDSIKAIFFERRHALISFSRAIAARMLRKSS
jgi:hypothetical protein